jgi:hypothetical protein
MAKAQPFAPQCVLAPSLLPSSLLLLLLLALSSHTPPADAIAGSSVEQLLLLLLPLHQSDLARSFPGIHWGPSAWTMAHTWPAACCQPLCC